MPTSAFRFSRTLSLACLLLLSVSTARGADVSPRAAKAQEPQGALQSLAVHPAQVVLQGPRSAQQLVVLGVYADGKQWDLTRQARFNPSPGDIVRVEEGMAFPARDGEAEIKVEWQGKSAVARVRVHLVAQGVDAETPASFGTEIIPLLTKLGCNQGACHGSQHGKNGFKLSLFGFDPEFDHAQIVKSAEGRRVVLSDPERSILLLKPSLTLEHGGGERMKPGSWQYNLLKDWLEGGAREPGPNDPTVTGLEVFPPRRLMRPGEQQQLAVRATWSDGRVADVTRTALFDSLNDSKAKVDAARGLVECLDRGETCIMIRFGGQASVFQVTAPFAEIAAHPPLEGGNFIDDHLRAKWRNLGLTPSGLCSDEEFLRRVYLDAIATLPTAEEIRAFLADQDPDKRKKAIDRVLERPEFVDFWALKWGDLLRNNRNVLQEKGMWSFHNWIRAALRDNVPVDQFVRDILTAEGSTYMDGPANYYRVGNNAADWAETTSQVFLGVRIQCARCHHHPFEKWSQDDYYALSAFFSRLATKQTQEFGIFNRDTVVHLRTTGEQTHPRKGGVVRPRPLDGQPMDDPFDRRRKLAEWLTAKDNKLFARNIVNRFWGYLMGRGLVEPLDDLRATNPPTNPELLDALAADFAQSGFNLKQLLRTIMNSRGYQLSADVTPGNQADVTNLYHARYTIKRLSAEQLADALDFATGTQEKYQGLPLGTRAIQLPDPGVRSFLLDVFGRPARQLTCECERTAVPNIAQALHLLNGDLINSKIARPEGRIAKLFKEKKPLPGVIEELFLATVCRMPRPEELQSALEFIGKAPNPQAGAEDLLWALLNTREFLFNH